MHMMRYNKYHIRDTDRFDPNDFPKVQAELENIVLAITGIPEINKEQIIISYLKDHPLEDDAITGNPELTRLLAAGHFITENIKALFESCRSNKAFLLDFEGYIRETLAENTKISAV